MWLLTFSQKGSPIYEHFISFEPTGTIDFWHTVTDLTSIKSRARLGGWSAKVRLPLIRSHHTIQLWSPVGVVYLSKTFCTVTRQSFVFVEG